MPEKLNIYIGYDPRQIEAFEVCAYSLRSKTSSELNIVPLVLTQYSEIYTRAHELRGNQLWDVISAAPMATEFAITRFLVPWLAEHEGKALYCDCDFLWRADVAKLFDLFDPKYALQVVKHKHISGSQSKMDGQKQTWYPRKNWSSLMLWNCGHHAHKALTLAAINTRPGRDLHAFCWLDDELIGELDVEWNWLAGISDPSIKPKAVHYTLGVPTIRSDDYADEWQQAVRNL